MSAADEVKVAVENVRRAVAENREWLDGDILPADKFEEEFAKRLQDFKGIVETMEHFADLLQRSDLEDTAEQLRQGTRACEEDLGKNWNETMTPENFKQLLDAIDSAVTILDAQADQLRRSGFVKLPTPKEHDS